MKSLLTIFNVAAEDDVCRLFLPFWQRSGCDLLFSSPYDARSRLDDVLHFHTGRAIPTDRSRWWHLQARTLATMRAVVELPHDHFIFTHYDSICFAPLPAPASVYANFACGTVPQFKAKLGLHPPWGFTREALKKFIETADRFDIQAAEQGIMDRWIALVLEASGLALENTAAWSWTANSIATPELVQSCRAAIAAGCRFIHGVKNQQQLDAILK